MTQVPEFFNPEEVKRRTEAKPIKPKRASKPKELDCESCGAYCAPLLDTGQPCKSPQMEMNGAGKKGIMVIAESPGPTEDETGKQLDGDAGEVIRNSMINHGLSLNRDCKRINAINCYLGRDRKGDFKKPTTKQLNACREVKVDPAIAKAKPKYIWLLGNHAIKSFFASRTKLKVTALQGRVIPDRRTGAWVIPMFHPSYVLRNRNDENLKVVWERGITRAINKLSHDPPTFPDPEPHITCITDYNELIKALDTILEWADLIVVDYETSGLKPHRYGHCIHSVSIAYHLEGDESPHCISFPLHYPGAWPMDGQEAGRIQGAAAANIADPTGDHNPSGKAWREVLGSPRPDNQIGMIEKYLVDILTCERIKKVAHNMKFEDLWSRVILGVTPTPWAHDTILGAHIIDNTQGVTGLKTQAWLIWGIEDYDAEFKQYREAYLTPAEKKAKVKPSDNHFNRVGEMPLDSLLPYGGYDGIIEYWLYERQMKSLRPGRKLTEAYDLFHEGTLAFCEMSEGGVPIDHDHYERIADKYHTKIAALEKTMYKSHEAKIFREDRDREIDFGSNPDLGYLFYDLLHLDPPHLTEGGRPSVDKEAIHMLDNEFANQIVERRGYLKIADTYTNQIMRESVNGRVYPSINLNIPVTYRSSINAPSLQNTPKREEEPKKAIRTGIIAEPGCSLLETDFGGIEVCGVQWYSQDKVLGDYLWTPGADMHRDQTMAIFDFTSDEWNALDPKFSSMLRFHIKNCWVFPEFYGAWYKSCAENIWDACASLLIGDGEGTTVQQWLGISYMQFEEFLRGYEDEFWSLFKGVREYQDSIGKEYRKFGYIESFLGFRFGGWMTQNNLYNYKVQGTAFHLLLWCLILLNKRRKERGWKSRILWQIHDSIVWNLHPEEREAIVRACYHIMTRVAPAHFPWINTPIKVEPEITDIDGTFYDLKTYDEDSYEAA